MTGLPIFPLESALADALASGESVSVFCYLPFGIVRGALAPLESDDSSPSGACADAPALMIELRDAVVEHYSNHLPTGRYDRLLLRIGDISGCVLLKA